ncbi:MAG: divergent polysaccharide deacetylase family protein [Deltaproteobacteria bacterium]|nr:divergent polysaccharide deacetylase family protein [Deltaproteobacteria bacterium]
MGKRSKRKGGPVFTVALLVFILGIAAVVFFEGYFKVRKPPVERPSPREARPREVPSLPRVAIVIDDMGGDMGRLWEITAAGSTITVSVLPHLRYSREVAQEAHRKGLEVLLHLPMEPMDSSINNPGKGALTVGMSEGEVRARLKDDIRAVPHIDGVNNHMGSLFTENEMLMKEVVGVLKERGLFFLESRTTPRSVALRVARESGIRTVERNIFLDNRRDRSYIKGQFEELFAIAKKKGRAVAIGHPYPETLEVLKEVMGDIKKQGVEVVRVSELAG